MSSCGARACTSSLMSIVLWANPIPLPTRWNFGFTLYLSVAVLRSIGKGLPCYPVWLPLCVASGTPEVHLSVLAVFVRIGAAGLPQLVRGSGNIIMYYEAKSRFACAATRRLARPLKRALSGNLASGLLLTPPSCYVGELPNSHGRT